MYSSHRQSHDHHGHPPQQRPPPPHHSPTDYHGPANGQRMTAHDPYQHSHSDMHNRGRMSSISDTRHTSPTLSRNSLTPIIPQDRPKPFYDVDPRPPYGAQPPYLPRSPVQVTRVPPPHDPVYRDRVTPASRRLSQASPPQSAHANSSMPFTNPPLPIKSNPPPSTRTNNPMSMSTILSDAGPPRADATPIVPPPSTSPKNVSSTGPPYTSISSHNSDRPFIEETRAERTRSTRPSSEHLTTSTRSVDRDRPRKADLSREASAHNPRKSSAREGLTPESTADEVKLHLAAMPTGPPGLTVRETEEAYEQIAAQELSDVEEHGFEGAYEEWNQRGHKRTLELAAKECAMRKRRRIAQTSKYVSMFKLSAELARESFVLANEHEAEDRVKTRDVEMEKKRKKDLQRKRRRERTLQHETQKRDEAMELLQTLSDEEERAKVLRDVQRAAKKVKNTEDLLSGKPITRERPPSPVKPAVEEIDATPLDEEATPEPTKGRKGKGMRPRKSKEQKQTEKENAINAQAAIDRGHDLRDLVKEEAKDSDKVRAVRAKKEEKDEGHAYSSKGYNQIYEQIIREIAKNQINKVYRIRNSALDTRQSNLRKTAQLAAKEARRWQLRTNKSTKDVQARAKRGMREMLSFWKKNERDERESRKAVERQELENAKRAEADREAARQKRKLNFLISQTELYSHFIGKKVKTDELERSTDSVAVSSEQTLKEAPKDAHTIDLPDSNANIATKVTNFEDLDFDAEDETVLQQAAMANAQNAVKEAQDRARAFDGDGAQSQFDDGEMNFQNPTSLQNMDVEQPKMLSCKLKEYQIKGLNWLVNLYEQGINGILADEMGLGKTVQSISVMAHLAEKHNIWGPFLVIAPASTLHNWQQEIAKFVPSIKVLPYWGNAKDRKVLRKFWDRKHITYNKDSSFHVLVTSYQLVVQDTPYFQKIKWQYMILDEAQAIKSSQSSRWKALLGFHCRNRLLLTGTPIQNNMQELWALLHFIMPSLFDSHDEFSDWFSKDIESHAQSNTKLNEDQLKRLHMILKPFMLRRVKKHVQKELGDKIEEDVFCNMTYRQRALYSSLRNKISLMDLIEKAAVGDDQDAATLMNLVMQFRKVCNHPDLFERADIKSPLSMSTWGETGSFIREGSSVQVAYSSRNLVEYWLPKLLTMEGRLDLCGPTNPYAGWRHKYLHHTMSIWNPHTIKQSEQSNGAFSWLRFVDKSAQDVSRAATTGLLELLTSLSQHAELQQVRSLEEDKENKPHVPAHSMLNIVQPSLKQPLREVNGNSNLGRLFNISRNDILDKGLNVLESCALPRAQAPPIELVSQDQHAMRERETTLFNVPTRRMLYPLAPSTEKALLEANVPPPNYPLTGLLPSPASDIQRYTRIQVPSMRRFVTDSGKLAQLDKLLKQLKAGGHRVLLYFQMTRMIDLMEEYLTYRNYTYCRLDGSTKLEDRRDTVAAFQGSDEIFVFLLSTRAGGLGINLVAADTVIFYDSDWNPTIDSQAMDRAHRLGQTRQVTVYRLITRGTIEERIRKRALQKEEVQRVVISGGAPSGQHTVDFNGRSKENRTKDIALWLADDDEAAAIERKEAELAEQEAKDAGRGKKRKAPTTKRKEISMDDIYHEGEGKFDDDSSNKPSGAATPVVGAEAGPAAGGKKKKGMSKKAKTMQERLAFADGN